MQMQDVPSAVNALQFFANLQPSIRYSYAIKTYPSEFDGLFSVGIIIILSGISMKNGGWICNLLNS